MPRCTFSCSSRCVRAGAKNPSATGPWGWSFRRSDPWVVVIAPIRGVRTETMQWTDEGIVLGAKRHGEGNAILELMTREHGRHLGLVRRGGASAFWEVMAGEQGRLLGLGRGGAGPRLKPILQPGNSLSATWRARLHEELGKFNGGSLQPRGGHCFSTH